MIASLADPGVASPAQGFLGRVLGVGMARALALHRTGEFAQSLETLLPLRDSWLAIGGSNAQRDVFEQVFLDSACRSGHPMAATWLRERLAARLGRNRFAASQLDAFMGASAGTRTRPSAI
jgi:hypothetical protein